MILRSVMKHVRDQNWFAVFLDFLIVVVGVFIGIQVANWNDEQAEDELAARYVSQLMNDIRSDISDIEVGYRTSEWRLGALSALLEKSGLPMVDISFLPEQQIEVPRPAISNDSITYLMNASTYTRFLDNDRPAYVSLLNSGNARLIERIRPWSCIQSYYAQYDEVRLFEERLLLFRTELVSAQHQAGISIAGHLSEEETLSRIRDNGALAAAMSSNRLFVYYHMIVLGDLRRQAELLLTTLESNRVTCDLGKSSL